MVEETKQDIFVASVSCFVVVDGRFANTRDKKRDVSLACLVVVYFIRMIVVVV
jgi:hypothetical protein